MKKIIFPLLVIIIGGLAYSVSKKNSDQLAATKEVAVEVGKGSSDGSFSGTIKDLMGLGRTQKCTWTAPDQGTTTVYVDGEKTRGEVSMLAMEGQPAQQMVTISDPTWAYSWNPATKKGMKVKVEEMNEEESGVEELEEVADGETQAGSDGSYEEAVNQEYEFKCESWNADPSMFAPPTDVEFTDMNAMMDQMQQNMGEMSKVCDMLSGTDKAECLKGFAK